MAARQHHVTYIDAEIDAAHPTAGIQNVLAILRPEWNQQLHIKKLSGGRLNAVYLCHQEHDSRADSSLVFRIFSMQYPVNRTNETCGIIFNHLAGVGTPIHAEFNNGLVLGFVYGRQMTRGDLDNPHMLKCIAKALAKIHTFDITAVDIVEDKTGEVIRPATMACFDREKLMSALDNMTDKCPDPKYQKRYEEEIPPKEELRMELVKAMDFLDKSGYDYGFIHYDANISNLIYEATTDKVTVLDSELCGNGYRVAELGLMMTMHQALTIGGNFSPDEEPVSPAKIKEYIQYYLEARAEIEGKQKSAISNKDIEKYYHQVQCITGILYFTAAILLFGQPNYNPETAGFDIIKFCLCSMAEYYKNKHFLDMVGP